MSEAGEGRRFEMRQLVRLGDTTQGTRLRLDALARYLQDVAAEDTADTHMPEGYGWVLRRMTWNIGRLPAIYEDLVLATGCTGVGGRWAERTTTLVGIAGLNDERTALAQGVLVTARAVWVSVSLATGAPTALQPEFFAAYGDGVRKHKVSARLTLPPPPPDGTREGFALRSTDFDVFGHVNNAIYWVVVEDYLAGKGAGQRVASTTVEFGGGVDPGDVCEVISEVTADTLALWFMVSTEVRAAIQVRFAADG